ncbi:unnamed protein product [Withania somnifera]
MDKRTNKGKQKIEMKLIESKEARLLVSQKEKESLFKKAEEYSTITKANVGVMLISPSGRPYSYGSTSIENITDKFLELKLDNHQRDHVDLTQLNVNEAFEDLRKDAQAPNEMHPHSKTLDKQRLEHRLEQLVSIKSRLDEVKKGRKGELAAPENA